MMDTLLTRPWDRLTRAEQWLALVAAKLTGEELGAGFDERLADEWCERQASRLADNPDLSSEYLIYRELVVERGRAQQSMTREELAYWHDRRSQQDPRVLALAHAWWGRVVDTLPLLAGEPCGAR